MGFNTGSMRNIYSPDVRTAQELMTDKLAKLAKMDPYEFRKALVKDPRGLAVLNKVAKRRQVGPHDARAHGAGHRDPQRVQGLVRGTGRDRLPARRP